MGVGFEWAARCLPSDLDELAFKRFDKEFTVKNEAIAIHLARHDGLGGSRFTKVHSLVDVLGPGGADEFRHVEF